MVALFYREENPGQIIVLVAVAGKKGMPIMFIVRLDPNQELLCPTVERAGLGAVPTRVAYKTPR